MINLRNLIFIFLILCSLPPTAQAKLTQTIDRNDIRAGETFVLDIRTDRDTDDSPDLSLIPEDFTIISNSQYQQTQIVNGQRSGIKGWKIKLKAVEPGHYTIPGITVGNEVSQPVQLNIKTSSFRVDLNDQDKAIFITAEVDQKSPYVQQQLILTISLYRSVATHYENLSAPTAEDSVIEKLGEDIVFDKTIDNRRYNVYQRKYVIFPQKSGKLKLSPITFTADVNDQSRRGRNVFLSATRPISVSTEAIEVNVRPKPNLAPNPWLPAQAVHLSDQWSPDSKSLRVGEPITWTVDLSVLGLSESQLPEIKLPQVDGLMIYPDVPQKSHEITADGLQGKRLEKFAVIPSKSGEIQIPEVVINWWHTKLDKVQTTSIPARTFKVLPAVAASQTSEQIVNPGLNTPPGSTLNNGSGQEIHSKSGDTQSRFWMYLSAAFLILWLTTLMAYLRKPHASKPSTDAKSKDPHTQSPSLSKQLKIAQAALASSSAEAIERSIIELVNSSGKPSFSCLGSIINQLTDPLMIQKLTQLEKQLYAAHPHEAKIELTKDDLSLILEQINPQPENGRSHDIPPLYPR